MEFVPQTDGTTKCYPTDGDTVDLVAFNFYGDHDGTSKLIWSANPGLAKRLVLKAGDVLILPPRPAPAPDEGINIFA
ncbi:hypothetical protein GCM10007094_24050 [Pseudovibrio japonicus]|uniref:Phage Tail Protein X n=1 Tax=Pseudovibrio japonicus TaxID=366534 RepID=A0ABQ3EGT8_9HYPH|nr:tail protein X [Pseudovibrio japonicus]GHB34160.1 hypothetical protein GCM10007094_24050 [Pseudovibrio japonicus]